MREYVRHLSDAQLILSSDSELVPKHNDVYAHLEVCAQCKERAAQFNNLVAQVAQAQDARLGSQLPPLAGPRAALRTRLAQMPSDGSNLFVRLPASTKWLAGAAFMAAIALIIVAATFTAHRYTTPGRNAASEDDLRPNHVLTPGAARRISLEKVCSLSHEEVVKQVSPYQRQKVFEEYGIPLDQADKYEVDYLITPGLGGDDDLRNLWPEPYNTPTWNAHVKDTLEERLHELVCSHRLDLSEAQKAITSDWIAAYKKYVYKSQSGGQACSKRPFSSIAMALFLSKGPRSSRRFSANRK